MSIEEKQISRDEDVKMGQMEEEKERKTRGVRREERKDSSKGRKEDRSLLGRPSSEPSSDEIWDVQACLVLSKEMKEKDQLKLKPNRHHNK